MKYIFTWVLLFTISSMAFSQNDSLSRQDTNTYRIIKTDGGELFGKILSRDAREILFLTTDNRQIYIPQHTIKEIVILQTKNFNSKGDFIGEDKFATRYFITTNGLPIKKGEHYVQWNIFGPDFQFGLGNNFGVGIMTSWIGMPLIGTIKKSFQFGENTHFALGALVGTGSWAAPDWGLTLPFGTLSFGNRTKNIAFSGGYGAIWTDGNIEGRAIGSIAGMIKVSSKISLVFDSFIMFNGKPTSYIGSVYNPVTGLNENQTQINKNQGFTLLIPGIRWHQGDGKAIQFGFSGVIAEGEFIPVPIPMIQWYRSL